MTLLPLLPHNSNIYQSTNYPLKRIPLIKFCLSVNKGNKTKERDADLKINT